MYSLGQAFSFPKSFSLFQDEARERFLQDLLDLLSLKKMSWEQFEAKLEDIFPISHLAASSNLRTLLHLAVIDNRIEEIKRLKDEPSLKSKRDLFGMSPIDLAKILNRKEALDFLKNIDSRSAQDDSLLSPYFESKKLFEQVLLAVTKAKKEDKIPSEKIWMGIYFDKEIQGGVQAPIKVQHINQEIGAGVFAKKKIASCSYVGEYTGKIVQKDPKSLKDKKYCLRYPVWGEKKNYAIDAEEEGNFTRFINHSFCPNLGLQSVYWRGIPRMIFITLREIKENEQLLFDYGPLFWKHSNESPLELL